MADKVNPRPMPAGVAPAAQQQSDADPAMFVLESLDAIASALEMQATIAAANFLLRDVHDREVRESPLYRKAIEAAADAALAYLSEPGENSATPEREVNESEG